MNKRIDIAVVGTSQTGKTFVIDALFRLLYAKSTYGPLNYKNGYNIVEERNNGINENEHSIHPDNISNGKIADIHSPVTLINSITDNIHDPAQITTSTASSTTEFTSKLYSGEVRDLNQSSFLITLYNISGESISKMFKSIDFIPHKKKPVDVISKLKKNGFWSEKWSLDSNKIIDENDNESWIEFIESCFNVEFTVATDGASAKSNNSSDDILQSDQVIGELNLSEDQKSYLLELKKSYLPMLYIYNATDILFCFDPESTNNTVIPSDILNYLKKVNTYRVVTKIDKFLGSQFNEELLAINTFEKLYLEILENLNNEVSRKVSSHFGEDFMQDERYFDFIMSCCLEYKKNKPPKFIPLETGKWSKTGASAEASDIARRSIGARELLSTIFYNNKMSIDTMGNLAIVDENLRKRYYNDGTFL